MNARTFESFTTWEQLLDHVAGEYRLFYQAPMDFRPVQVSVVRRKDGKLRVYPIYTDADPFTADIEHFPRFRRETPNV